MIRIVSVPGFGRYVVSEMGVVFRKRGMVLRPLKPAPKRNGYQQVTLRADSGEYRYLGIHQVVMMSFVGPCPDGQQVMHTPDDDKTNNCLSNLKYGTPLENCADRDTARGELSGMSKLIEEEIRKIRRLAKDGNTYEAIIMELGLTCNCGHIGKIVRGELWAHVS